MSVLKRAAAELTRSTSLTELIRAAPSWHRRNARDRHATVTTSESSRFAARSRLTPCAVVVESLMRCNTRVPSMSLASRPALAREKAGHRAGWKSRRIQPEGRNHGFHGQVPGGFAIARRRCPVCVSRARCRVDARADLWRASILLKRLVQMPGKQEQPASVVSTGRQSNEINIRHSGKSKFNPVYNARPDC